MPGFSLRQFNDFSVSGALNQGSPSHDTLTRVFAALDPQACLEFFLRWTQCLRQVVALDGKASSRAINKGQCPKAVVSAWAAAN